MRQPRSLGRRDVEAELRRDAATTETLGERSARNTELNSRFSELLAGVDRTSHIPMRDLWTSCGPNEAAPIARIGEGALGLAAMVPARSNVVFSGEGPAASEALRSWLLRLLASRPAGSLRIRFADPTYMGNSLGTLFELRGVELLVGSGPAVTGDEVAALLEYARQRVSQVNSQALRGRYASIDEFNHDAPIPEHQLVVAAFGIPGRWSASQISDLAHLAEMGPPCGVSVLASIDATEPTDSALSKAVERLRTGKWTTTLDHIEPSPELRGELARAGTIAIDTAGSDDEVRTWLNGFTTSASEALAPAIDITTLLVDTGLSSADGLVIPIGIGANEPVAVTFADDPVHGLVVGGTGSGKTTMLHTLIHSAAQRYSPDELELWLIDLKEGVEFRQYANDPGPGLPHARVVACASDPEFALAAMEGLVAEGRRRGEMFRECNVRGLAAYRESSGAALPRILCIIDECHLLLGDRKLGQSGWNALAWLAKEGRAFGIHVLLATQSLAGMGVNAGETASVWRQIQMRLALRCHASDAALIFGDINTAAQGLAPKGDGVLNNAFGDPAANIRLQVAHTPDELASEIRAAQAEEWGRRTDQIAFTGDELAQWTPLLRTSGNRSITLGRPLDLDAVVEVPLDLAQRIGFIGPSAGTTAALTIAAHELARHAPHATVAVIEGSATTPAAGQLAADLHAALIRADQIIGMLTADLPDVIIGFNLDRLRVPLPDDWRSTAQPPLAQLLALANKHETLFLGAWSNPTAAYEQCGGSTTRPPFTITVDTADGAAGALRGLVTFHPSSAISRAPRPFIPWAPLEGASK